jgi:hypothetical protein
MQLRSWLKISKFILPTRRSTQGVVCHRDILASCLGKLVGFTRIRHLQLHLLGELRCMQKSFWLSCHFPSSRCCPSLREAARRTQTSAGRARSIRPSGRSSYTSRSLIPWTAIRSPAAVLSRFNGRGALWFRSQVAVDRDAGTVTIINIKVLAFSLMENGGRVCKAVL